MTDIKLIHTSDGGDIQMAGNDLATVSGVENTVYLAMFGGRKWVGNVFTEKPYQCLTEQTLDRVTLNSAGLLEIQNAVDSDLSYLSNIEGTTWTASVAITGPNSVKIDVDINGERFTYMWNPDEATPVTRSTVLLCPVVTGLSITYVDASSLTFSFTGNGAPGYQYAYNTTGSEPVEEDWTDTTSTTILLTSLTSDTDYYVFVRTVCADGIYSAIESASATTTPEILVLPTVTTGTLIEALVSTAGVSTSGTKVLVWADQSGNGNDVEPPGLRPDIEANIFGSKPGIHFTTAGGSHTLKTASDIIGLSGESAMTVFAVGKHITPSGALQVFAYANSPGAITAGEVETYVEAPGGSMRLNTLARGNAGFDIGYVTTVADTAYVYTVDVDFSAAAASELVMYKNNSTADYTLLSSNANTNTFISAPFMIGAAPGHMGAYLIYAGRLDITDRTAVVNALKTYFSIP